MDLLSEIDTPPGHARTALSSIVGFSTRGALCYTQTRVPPRLFVKCLHAREFFGCDGPATCDCNTARRGICRSRRALCVLDERENIGYAFVGLDDGDVIPITRKD